MSITPNQEEDGRPRGQPPTAVQCALALVTAGLAVAAAMLALVGTAQADYLASLPEDESYLQDPASTPAPARALCPSTLPATYSGTVWLDGRPAAEALTLTASIDGEAWATAIISDSRYTIDIPQHTPEIPPCFPASGTIVFTLDGYTCMPAEEREGTGWVALGYRSFAPGLYDADLVCLATPTSTPSPDDAALAVDDPDGSLEAAADDPQSWQAQLDSAWATRVAWEQTLNAFPNSEYRTQAYLWLTKLDQALLSHSEGTPAPDSADAPQTQAWLEGQTDIPSGEPEGIIQTPAAPDWDAVEGWLTSLWGPEPPWPGPALFDSIAWQSGQQFHQSGLEREATGIFLLLIDESSSQPWSLYRLARAFDDLDMPHLSARTATRLLWKVDSPLEQIPRALVELAYPLAYPSLVQAAASENDLSPLLLLALIRQESFFDPLAVSSAGALGLTQVMPSTGQGIAAALNLESFSTSDLLQPQVSIRFGAYYLSSQLDSSAGNLLFALAAYNAGPDNARRWTENLPIPDIDLFIELIDFAETRSYVKLVLENYAVYRFLYADADEPALLTKPDEATLPTDPDDPAFMVEPRGPALMTEPHDPALLADPDEPALPTEPHGPALMIEPHDPALLTDPDEPVLMIEPDEPVLMIEP
ncbi:MAG: transglycosylase SLT domain-containing protein [Dehalococcoidia bacterium]|nr:MAG: transglycosylase SLT domain-containing protein [Dehalococcoidia bacterium]